MKLSEKMREYETGEMDRWADEVEQLEARLMSIECGECGKNMLECNAEECDKLAITAE